MALRSDVSTLAQRNPRPQVGEHAITPLNYHTLIALLSNKEVALQPDERRELQTVLEKNEQCIRFSGFVDQLNEIDASSLGGIGLTDNEKTHYNYLVNESKARRPEMRETLSEMRVKLNDIRVYSLEIAKYSNIIKLYQAYLDVLHNEKLWTEDLSSVKSEWETHGRVARYDSRELLSIYRAYQNALDTTRQFSNILTLIGKEMSPAVLSALLLYANHVKEKINDMIHQAIISMVLRLQLTDQFNDIYFDDVIYYTVSQIERIRQHRIIVEQEDKRAIFDELRRRRRRGLTFNTIRLFVDTIERYLSAESESENTFKFSILQSKFNRLSMRGAADHLSIDIKKGIDDDPVLLYLINQIDVLAIEVRQCLMLEMKRALTGLTNLHDLLNEADRVFTNIKRKAWFYSNEKLEHRLKYCRDKFGELIAEVDEFFEERLNQLGSDLIQNVIRGDISGLAEYEREKTTYQTFYEKYLKYNVHENAYPKRKELLYQVVFLISKDPSCLQSKLSRNTLVNALAQDYYWPVDQSNAKDYESTRQLLGKLFEYLSGYLGGAAFFINAYQAYNWMLYYLEQAFPLNGVYRADIHAVLSRECHFPWENPFLLDRVLLNDRQILFVPKSVRGALSITAANNPNSDRYQFLTKNSALLLELERECAFFKNATLPYVAMSPFVTLLTINYSNRYFHDHEHLMKRFDRLIESIDTDAGNGRKTYKAKRLLDQLKQYCLEKKKSLHDDWIKALFEAFYSKASTKDIALFLASSSGIIDRRKLAGLLENINTLFESHERRQFLIEKIQEGCAALIVEKGLMVLSQSNNTLEIFEYSSELTEISQIELVGPGIVERVITDRKIATLIQGHLTSFDGSRSEIGGLIVALYPANTLSMSNFIEMYVLPYTKKRLENIKLTNGQSIELADVVFFEAFKSVLECQALFRECKTYYESNLFDKVINNASIDWDEGVAKLVELFGDDSDRYFYRSKCIVSLMENEHPTPDDYRLFAKFNKLLLRHSSVVLDPQLMIANMGVSFEVYIEKCVDIYSWNPLRANILNLFDRRLRQRYNLRFLYQFLNNHVPDFGKWMQGELDYVTPQEMFGDQGVDNISEHVMGLIKVVHLASRDMAMDELQIGMMSALLPNLKYMRSFFQALGDYSSYLILQDIEELENNIRLAGITSKLFSLLRLSDENVTYDEKSKLMILSQFNVLYAEIETNSLIRFENIKSYLDSLDTVLKHVFLPSYAELQEVYLSGYLNFLLNTLEHFKKIIIQFIKNSIIPDSESSVVSSLTNFIDQYHEIEKRRYPVLLLLEHNPSLKDVVHHLMDTSMNIAAAAENIVKHLEDRLCRGAKINKVTDDPIAYTMACIKNITHMNTLISLSAPYIEHQLLRIEDAINLIHLSLAKSLNEHVLPALEMLERPCAEVKKGNSNPLLLHSVFKSGSPLPNPMLQPLYQLLHLKNDCHVIYAKIHDYVQRKTRILLTGPAALSQLLTRLSQQKETNPVNFIAAELQIKQPYNARKVFLMLDLLGALLRVYAGKAKRDDLTLKINQLLELVTQKELSGDHRYYKAKEFKLLLLSLKEIVEPKHQQKQEQTLTISNLNH